MTPNRFIVASLSYAKLSNEASTGDNLIYLSTKFDIGPFIRYVELEYRFHFFRRNWFI